MFKAIKSWFTSDLYSLYLSLRLLQSDYVFIRLSEELNRDWRAINELLEKLLRIEFNKQGFENTIVVLFNSKHNIPIHKILEIVLENTKIEMPQQQVTSDINGRNLGYRDLTKEAFLSCTIPFSNAEQAAEEIIRLYNLRVPKTILQTTTKLQS